LQRTVSDLVASDERFRRFMGHPGILAVIKDGRGRYVYMNPTAEQARRRTAAEWYGRTDLELSSAAEAGPRVLADEGVRSSGAPSVETAIEDGRTWLFERFPVPGDRRGVGVLGIDMTGRVRAERRLEAAEREADRHARERGLIAETLQALDAGRTPEETANAVCARILQLPGIAIASVIIFGIDGLATIVGQAVVGGVAGPG